MNKILQWWYNSQFEGGEYIISNDDALVFVSSILENNDARQKLKSFFDERFVVEVDGKESKDFPLAIFQNNFEEKFEEVVVDENINTFFDWMSICIKETFKNWNLEEFKEKKSDVVICFNEQFYGPGSWKLSIKVLEMNDDGEIYHEMTYYTGTKSADALNWEIRYVHPEISLREAVM